MLILSRKRLSVLLHQASVVLAGVGLLTALSAQANTTIDTTSTWDGSNSVWPFGNQNTATYGQTFTTGTTDLNLQSFSFYLSPLDQPFQAYVGEWDGAKASNILYQSETLSAGTGFTGFKEITLAPNLQLSANKQYVAFFSTSGLQDGLPIERNNWGYLGSDVYANGAFVFFNNGNDKTALTTQTWDNFFHTPNDLAFKAVLTPVPEPETYALLLAGLAVLGGVTKRRKHKQPS